MKSYIPYSLLAAAAACGLAYGETAYTTPVGYYQFEGKGGGNLFVPGIVNPSVFAGQLTAATTTTLTVAADALTADAFNAGPVYATHFVEITSGPNAGVVADIVSNTASVITLADTLGFTLVGDETVTIRPHVTLKSSLAAAEGSLNPFSDVATFYGTDGSVTTYTYGADPSGTGWSSNFVDADGDVRPIPPGTGFVLGLVADVSLTVSGEVKASPTGVFMAAGFVNIVGPVNPLVGTSASLNTTGLSNLAAFSDSITVYQPGPLTTELSTTYTPLGDGTLSSDFSTPTTDTISNTTGAVVIPSADATVLMNQGFTVGQ